MENTKLKNIIEQARNEDFKEKLKISENLQKYYDFDDEIKNLNIEVTLQVLKEIEDSNNNLLILMLSIFLITSLLGGKFIFSYELSPFISLVLIILFFFINLIFWIIVLAFFFKTTPKIYENEEEYLYDSDVFMAFEKVYYPEEYREEFKKIFFKYYGKYKDEFCDWVSHSEMNNRELYKKLLDNKKLQYDILNEIKNKLDDKKLQEEKELLEKNIRKNKIKNFFENINKE